MPLWPEFAGRTPIPSPGVNAKALVFDRLGQLPDEWIHANASDAEKEAAMKRVVYALLQQCRVQS